jgi:hypothetical protein
MTVHDDVDIVGDIHRRQLVRLVVCTGTLEHVPIPSRRSRSCIGSCGREASSTRRAVHSGLLSGPDGLLAVYPRRRASCANRSRNWQRGHTSARLSADLIIRAWANSWSSNRIISNLLLVPVALVVTPFKYLDYLMIGRSRGHHVASAVFFRGRKRAVRPSNNF